MSEHEPISDLHPLFDDAIIDVDHRNLTDCKPDDEYAEWPEAHWPTIASSDDTLLVQGFFSIKPCPESTGEVEEGAVDGECWRCLFEPDRLPNNRLGLCNDCYDKIRGLSGSMEAHESRGVEDAP